MRVCRCGCGGEVSQYSRAGYRRGHHFKGRVPEPRICACGCGQLVPPIRKAMHGENAGYFRWARPMCAEGHRWKSAKSKIAARRAERIVPAEPIQRLLLQRFGDKSAAARALAQAFGLSFRSGRQFFRRQRLERQTAERILRWLAGQPFAPSIAQRKATAGVIERDRKRRTRERERAA